MTVLGIGVPPGRSIFESIRYVMEHGVPWTGLPVYGANPALQLRLATVAMALSTAIGARRYTSAKCAVAQSTTVTVTRLRSAGGRSATHSPTCRSIHFSFRDSGGVAAALAVVGSIGIAARPHHRRRARSRLVD